MRVLTTYRARGIYTLDPPRQAAEQITLLLAAGVRVREVGDLGLLFYRDRHVYGLPLARAVRQGWCRFPEGAGERADGWTYGRTDEGTCGSADVWTYGRTDEGPGERADVRTCGRADEGLSSRGGERLKPGNAATSPPGPHIHTPIHPLRGYPPHVHTSTHPPGDGLWTPAGPPLIRPLPLRYERSSAALCRGRDRAAAALRAFWIFGAGGSDRGVRARRTLCAAILVATSVALLALALSARTRPPVLSRSGVARTELAGVALHHADLRNADLAGARLSGADLRAADLRNARLQGAMLERADLRGAQLEGADLTGAALEGADLAGARYDAATRWPAGMDPRARGALPDGYATGSGSAK